MKKIFLCILMLTMVLIFTNTIVNVAADLQKKDPPVFNKTKMRELETQGYEWNDLVEGSILSYKYQIPLKTIMFLKSEECTWQQVDETLNIVDKIKKGQDEDKSYQRLQQANFTEKEAFFILYSSVVRGKKKPRSSKSSNRRKKG